MGVWHALQAANRVRGSERRRESAGDRGGEVEAVGRVPERPAAQRKGDGEMSRMNRHLPPEIPMTLNRTARTLHLGTRVGSAERELWRQV